MTNLGKLTQLRKRVNAVSVLVLAICAGACVLVWYFDVFEHRAIKMLTTALVGLVVVWRFTSAPTSWRDRGELLWLGAAVVGALLLLAGDKFDQSVFLTSAALFLSVLALWWLTWRLMGRRWFLLTGLALALALLMFYWISALLLRDVSANALLLPVPTVVLVGIIWSPCARGIFAIARNKKGHRVTGAGTQALAMSCLFLLAIVVTVGAPITMELGETWVAVSIAVAGFILATVVAEPLRNFLMEWADLD